MASLRAQSFGELFSFTRSTVATYCNSSGVLTQAAVDEARMDYDPATLAPRGMLIEGARTNYLLRSQEFDNASWTKTRASVSGASVNAIKAPDGTVTGDKLIEDATANETHYVAQSYTKGSSTEVQAYAASVWVKAAGRTQIRLQCQGTSGTTNSAYALCDLSLGIASVTGIAGAWDNLKARVEAWPSGWYRCTLEFRVNNDGQASLSFIVLLANNFAQSYTGDGASGVYLWGAQLEKGFQGSSYIPTTTASAAREVDVCAMQSLSPWFNEAEGSLFVEWMVPWDFRTDATGSRRVIQIDDGSEVDRFIVFVAENSGARLAYVTAASVNQATISRGTASQGVTQRQAFSWATDDVSATASGSTVSSDTAATIPSGLTTFRFGRSASLSELFGYIRKVQFWPHTLSDAELQALVA